MGRLLLLDVDGVVVRDPLLMQHLTCNIREYIRAKLPEAPEPAKVARLLYNRYGHTGRGLTSAFGIDSSDFNEKVYDASIMEHLACVLASKEFQEDADSIREISRSGWDVRFFSNAPEKWTQPIAKAISDSVDWRQEQLWWKPDPRAYTHYSIDDQKFFVDDSIKNLWTANYMWNWRCIHFSPNKQKDSKFLTIGSLWELGLLTRSIDTWAEHQQPHFLDFPTE